MNKKIFFLILLLQVFCIESAYCNKRTRAIRLTTSVTIPCHHKHAIYLYDLLKYLEKQSTLPDEVVISLSGTNKIPQNIIEKIRTENWTFPLQLLTFPLPKSEGENRNITCEYANGDIIICQDADDIPHPQRVQIIKYFFENYEVVHLMHQLQKKDQFKKYGNMEKISYYITSNFSPAHTRGIFGNGICSFLKELHKEVKWNEEFKVGVDVDFNKRIYAKHKNNILIQAPLYAYRPNLSSYE